MFDLILGCADDQMTTDGSSGSSIGSPALTLFLGPELHNTHTLYNVYNII